jgi:hypothetical protein
MHDLTMFDYSLPDIDDWLSGDSRTLAFTVVDADGNAVDISAATVSWTLHNRAYQDASDSTVLSGSDSGVELVTDSRVDTANGEWEVRVSDDATTDDIYGEYFHRPVVEQADGSVAAWRGRIVISA